MPASDRHPAYMTHLRRWQLVRDCVEGSEAIKTRTSADTGSSGSGSVGVFGLRGTRYLPAPNAEDVSRENQLRYEAYRERASFVNFTGHTVEGMMGMVFRQSPTLDLPASIEFLEDDSTGGGLSLEQLTKQSTAEALELGRFGLLTDFPTAPEGLTQQEVNDLGLRTNILPYTAESIINWRAEMIGGIKKLTLVVLREKHRKYSDDGFAFEEVDFHRVLKLEGGVYIQMLFNQEDEPETHLVDGEPVIFMIPRKADGSVWDEIPFAFIGSENNDEVIDKAPLSDIAEINVSHYRNSADYEESSFMVGQPTPIISGLTQSWVDEVLKTGVTLGSRTAVLLPEGGSGTLMQAESNQMPLKGMEIKEKQMIMIGARIIQDNGGVETAEAARIRFAGQNSKLGNIVGNVESAFKQVFAWALEFQGGEGEVVYDLNREFYPKTVDPQMLMAQMQLVDRGTIAQSDMRKTLRATGMISHDRTDDDIDEEVGDQSPIA